MDYKKKYWHEVAQVNREVFAPATSRTHKNEKIFEKSGEEN